MTNREKELKSNYWIMGTGIYRPFDTSKPSEKEMICKCDTVEQAHAIRNEIVKIALEQQPTVMTVEELSEKFSFHMFNNGSCNMNDCIRSAVKWIAHDYPSGITIKE